jgi:hypothetical protein
LAGSFGGKGDLKGADRFKLGRWTTLTTGAPILEGALGETIERHNRIIAIRRDYTADPVRAADHLQRWVSVAPPLTNATT